MDPIQVVAGALYKFTLQLEHTQSEECATRDETEECKVLVWRRNFIFFCFCFFARWLSGEGVFFIFYFIFFKVVVWEKKWQNFKEVQWDQTTCKRD